MKAQLPFLFIVFFNLLFGVFAITGSAQPPNPLHFEHISVGQGLPSPYVYAFTQDSKGFLWIGTSLGLSRYDGYGSKIYRYDLQDSTLITSAWCLFEDKRGGLWIGTDKGLKYLDFKTGQFTSYKHDPKNSNSLSSGPIISILEDSYGVLWVGSYGDGLNRLNQEDGSIHSL
ncbi:MAG: hypothetical protein H6560_05235 [Lewinellaceae bacterium]|nr:hypothetical protein [Lewinellaceae bacterium]